MYFIDDFKNEAEARNVMLRLKIIKDIRRELSNLYGKFEDHETYVEANEMLIGIEFEIEAELKELKK